MHEERAASVSSCELLLRLIFAAPPALGVLFLTLNDVFEDLCQRTHFLIVPRRASSSLSQVLLICSGSRPVV